MMEDWYKELLQDLTDFGEEQFIEEVEEGMYPEEARKLLVEKRAGMSNWKHYEQILNIFKNVYR